jgi:SAM-dependent methyltransferase
VSGIHRTAATGFARSADAYQRGRPGYPPAALALLAERLGLHAGRTVLDLAAGTGALTRALTETGVEVIAVEPVAEMRVALPAEVRSLEGTAEAIPLDDASVDAVTVAQAFHWFDGAAALREIHRVLRPGGRLAVVWNRRIEDDAVNRAIGKVVEPYRQGTPTHRGDAWRAAFEATDLFGPLELHVFPNDQRLDADGIEARVMSISFIASLPDDERAKVARAARELAADGALTVPHRTAVYLCDVRRA